MKLWAVAAVVFAGFPAEGATTNDAGSGPFRLWSEVVAIPEAGDVTNLVIEVSAGALSFQPPAGWRLRVDPAEGRLAWTSEDYTSVLYLRLRPDPDGAMREALATIRAPGVRARLAELCPDARVIDDVACYTSGEPGRAFELDRAAAGRDTAAGRAAFFPVAGVVAELVMWHPAEQQANRQMEFGRLLHSCRATAAAAAPSASRTLAGSAARAVVSGRPPDSGDSDGRSRDQKSR